MRAKTIAIANQKGGVGKTTSCVNLAAAVAMQDKTVLLIDLDPQGNATMGSGINKNAVEYTIADVLLGQVDITTAILAAEKSGFSVLPSNADVTAAEIGLIQIDNYQHQLTKAISTINNKYDYIFIDCPPSLNTLTLNALVAADSIIIPMQCEYYALEGLTSLMSTIEQIKQELNPKLKVEGLIRTMYDPRNKLALEVTEQLIGHFGSLVYKTVVPRNVRLAEAPSHGLPVMMYDKASKGSKAYMDLAAELLMAEEIIA